MSPRWWWRPRRVDVLILLATVLIGALLGVAAYAVSQVAEARSDAVAQARQQAMAAADQQALLVGRLDELSARNSTLADQLRASHAEQGRLAAEVAALAEQVRQLGATPVATPRPVPRREQPRPQTPPSPTATTPPTSPSAEQPQQAPPRSCLPIIPICP